MKINNLTYKNNLDHVVADPFVYRWLGEYYLFGTGDYCPIYKSKDLINWCFVGTAIEPNSENVDIKGCYAPEVVYLGGLFYIIYSPKGNEHRIYSSKNLTSGYTPCDNIFEGIDGSFYIEKNGVTLFRSADVKGKTKDGIYYKTCPTITGFDRDGWKRIPNAYLNGWTEGPFLTERKGYKYLTFTGNHYLSEGYRIKYLSGTGEDYENYNYGDTLIISTDKEYNGLGHSANVIGPNLDSIIITYHNLAVGKKRRFYNFSTLITDDKRLFCNGICNYDSPLPLKADFECKDTELLIKENDKLVIPTVTNGVFTAELSFKKSSENIIYSGNYTLSLKDNLATLYNDKESFSANFTPILENSVYVVRIVCDDILKIYINSQEIFSVETSVKGHISYDKNTTPLYSALTLDAFGSSDKKLIKNIPSVFPANSCENKQESICQNGINYILPNNAFYKLNAGFSGKYGVVINTKSQNGGTITFKFGNKKYTCQVEKGEQKCLATIVKLSKGINNLLVNSNAVYISDINFILLDKKSAKINSQKDFIQVFSQKELPVPTGELTYLQSKYKTFNGKLDFVVENSKEYNGGIVIREQNFAHFKDHPTESFYGYLVAVFDNKLHFYKCEYGKKLLCEFDIKSGKISVEFNKNNFKFYNEKELIGEHTDTNPYLYGNIGILALKDFALSQIKLNKN